jgi:all-trans-retinol 13,14-reductase
VEDYDVIVIGSGIGGLAAATALTTLAKKRVLVLERHFALGGFTHEFQRHRFRWDVGLHYVGGMAPGTTSRALMELVTGGTVDWAPMPEDFDVFHYPDLEVRASAELFPEEAKGIDAYFDDVRRAAAWAGRETWSWSAKGPMKWGMGAANAKDRRISTRTTADQMARRITDPRLRAVLTSQWGDYGLPPGRSAFAQHARVVEAGGGSCRINHEVTEILVEGGSAVGVRAHVRKGRGGYEEEFRAPVVISDAGAHTTYSRLLPAGAADGAAEEVRAAVEAAEPSVSCVTLYLGLRESPETIGLHGENHWHYTSFDHDAVSDEGLLRGDPAGAYVSFPSAKDPEATRHTAEIISFCTPEAFAPWAGTDWMRRGEDYEALKTTITEGLLAFVEERHPGLRDLVEYSELSTPLTVETFTGHRAGGIYGLAATPSRYEGKLVAARSPVPGLLLAGTDVCSLGIMGALMGGVFAAGEVLGPAGFPTIMKSAGRRAAKARPSAGQPR